MEEKETLEKYGLISQIDLCVTLKLSRYAIYRAIKAGTLTPIKIGTQNYFEKDEVDRFIGAE